MSRRETRHACFTTLPCGVTRLPSLHALVFAMLAQITPACVIGERGTDGLWGRALSCWKLSPWHTKALFQKSLCKVLRVGTKSAIPAKTPKALSLWSKRRAHDSGDMGHAILSASLPDKKPGVARWAVDWSSLGVFRIAVERGEPSIVAAYDGAKRSFQVS